MRSPTLLASILAASGLFCVTSIALAATSWTDFSAIPSPIPCSDGWAGCLVGGKVLDPGGVRDAAGRPHPSASRVGFFDLQPLPAFDPFPPLSRYSAPPRGEAPVAAVTPEPEPEPGLPAPDPEPLAVNASTPPPATDPRIATTRETDRTPPVTNNSTVSSTSTEIPGRTPLGTPPVVGSSTSSTSSTSNTTVPSMLPPSTRQGSTTAATTTAASTPSTSPPASSTVGTAAATNTTTTPPAPPQQRDGVAMSSGAETRTTPPTPAAQDSSCDDLVALEAPAMMGTLGVGRRKCLEGRLASESSQTMKKKISLVLMQDAETRQDQADWERLIKSHLQDIDRSDPNLCFKYAIHLSRSGRHSSVIRWADYALENKQQWEGATYKKNVYMLYKLRAQAANSLWEGAEKKFVTERSDENEAEATKWRDTTKNYAREWLDYARASQQTTTAPLALCVSAAGSADFCEG